MNITTTYKTNAQGRSQILAKANGKQRTHNIDQSKSLDWNHGTAAGALLLAVPANPFSTAILVKGLDAIQHTANDSGTVHRFSI